jgi:hypothetical protein
MNTSEISGDGFDFEPHEFTERTETSFRVKTEANPLFRNQAK